MEPVRAGRPVPSGDFQRAVDLTRTLAVDEVYIAVPWAETETIDLCVEAMLNLPVAIHLAPEEVLDRFDRVTIARVGPMASLELTRPMAPLWVFAKRVVDVLLSSIGLVLLSPLLLNVIAGDMSLVGPRPHAVPHNRSFEAKIALYARRHNVRPGITGWAQVNGLRGETDTDVKMRARVEHDLYYIDNWSLLFDLRILLRTVFSRRAYRNAY